MGQGGINPDPAGLREPELGSNPLDGYNFQVFLSQPAQKYSQTSHRLRIREPVKKKKKKCGKFHSWGGGPDLGIFQISKKKKRRSGVENAF